MGSPGGGGSRGQVLSGTSVPRAAFLKMTLLAVTTRPSSGHPGKNAACRGLRVPPTGSGPAALGQNAFGETALLDVWQMLVE